MVTSKPDLTRVWANGAPPANVVDPDTTTPGKFNAGWQAEVPPFEHFNFLQKLFTQGLAHFNEEGIGVWDTNTTYPINGLAKGSNGEIYKSILEQSGNDPVSDTGDNWIKFAGVKFTDSVASMKSSNYIEGDLILTKSYYNTSFIDSLGASSYIVVDSSNFSGTPDEYGDHTLDNGNIAVLIYDGEFKASQFGVTGNNASVDKLACQALVARKKNVHFDIDQITIPTLASGEALFLLDSTYKNIKHRGPCRFITDGVLARYNYLYEPKGCEDITVEDIQGEDTVNKSDVMTAQGGLVFCRVNDFASGDRGCIRFRMVRPAMFGGGALFQPIGTVNDTDALECSIIDGHAEDTYYGINCAASGNGLKANMKCVNVKRAYFPYDVSDQDVVIDSENPGSSNAHFLLKTYDPTKGLRDITAKLRVKGDTVAGRGRLVFEQQDEATDDSIIENIDVTLFDERTLDTESVFFRAYENPTTERVTTNSVWRNITIRGVAEGLRFFSKSTKPVVLQWLASDRKTGSYIGVSDLFSYKRMFTNDTYSEVLFRQGVDRYTTFVEGVAGPGLDYLFPLGKMLKITGDTSVTLRFKVALMQGSAAAMNNHTCYEFDVLCRYSGGTVTITKSADRNLLSTATPIVATVTASGDAIRFQSAALGASQFLLLDASFI